MTHRDGNPWAEVDGPLPKSRCGNRASGASEHDASAEHCCV